MANATSRWMGMTAGFVVAATALTGCASGGSMAGGHASSTPAAEGAPPAPPAAMAYPGSASGAKASVAPSPRATSNTLPSDDAGRDADRPGLATQWGETRRSEIHTTSFERADSEPFALTSLWYNDREGSRAMAQTEGFRSFERTAVDLASNGVTVSLRDENGHVLPGYAAGGKTFAVGEAGRRYTIVLVNHTPARFEAVVSVDGLDVLDGKPASPDKRGYILHANDELEIDGFRQSESAVAAFRFGSVKGSYAAKTGDDRNVGVIGVALFGERGVARWPWNGAELDRRKGADPFPGRFASPPPP